MNCPYCNKSLITGDADGVHAGCVPFYEYNASAGWECPRCFKIHSPFSLTCDCPSKTISKSTVDENCSTCFFSELVDHKNGRPFEYKCKKHILDDIRFMGIKSYCSKYIPKIE